MNITELLQKTLDTDYQHICLNITTVTDIYQLCFIDYEDHEKLGCYLTGADGRERFIIIYKDQLVALQVIYEQDIKLELDKTEDGDVMVI